MEDVSSLVARQYEAFAYPEPFGDLVAEVSKGYFQIGDPALYGPVLWPHGRPERSLTILVAGCGTVQAAYTAYMNPQDEVIGVDLSETSLAHERFLQDRHALSNLKLFKGDLLELGSLRRNFDVILCTGVLHHLSDPEVGLKALAQVLAPSGVMVLMLYGRTARSGVYMLQDAFRRMQIPQSAEGAKEVRKILRELPGRHYAQDYIRAAAELRDDAALIDTFLHAQDRAYTVPEIMELVQRSGLRFENWVDSHPYWRNCLWGPESAVAAAVDPLPAVQHWAAVEMLGQLIGMHFFTARHRQAPAAAVDFDRGPWLSFVPHHSPGLARKAAGAFVRGQYELYCTPLEQFVLDGVNGKRTIDEIIQVPALEELPSEERNEFARRYFEHLWKLGHVMVTVP